MDRMYYMPEQLPEDIGKLLEIARKASATTGFTNVYGVPGGGCVIAVAFALAAGLPLIDKDLITNTTLIIDDIVAIGMVRARYPDNYIMSLYQRVCIDEDKKPNFALYTITNDQPISFFWEKEISQKDAFIQLLRVSKHQGYIKYVTEDDIEVVDIQMYTKSEIKNVEIKVNV